MRNNADSFVVRRRHPRTDVRHATIYLLVCAAFVVAAFMPGLLGSGSSYGTLILLWPASNWLALGFSYACNGDIGLKLLGKSRKTGHIHCCSWVFFMPYFVISFMLWRIKHMLLRERVCDEVWSGGIWVGRYPWEISVHDQRFSRHPITHVVDLTGELPRLSFHNKVNYMCCPSLDRLLCDPALLADACESLPNSGIYIHCANGHGRSGLFAALYLVHNGMCKNIDEAKIVMKRKRSVLNWQPHQQAVAEEALIILRQGRTDNDVELRGNW